MILFLFFEFIFWVKAAFARNNNNNNNNNNKGNDSKLCYMRRCIKDSINQEMNPFWMEDQMRIIFPNYNLDKPTV